MMETLRLLRKEKHLTLKQLGELVGVAESTMSQYETGKRQPDYRTLVKLAGIFGVSTDYLLRGDPQEQPDTAVTFDDFTYAMYGETRELTDENKLKLLELARFFKQEQERERREKREP